MKRKLDRSTEVRLILVRPLDRESCLEHSFTLIAVDAGRPPRSGSASVIVSVLDANDNGPVFEHRSYDVTVAENVAIGTTVTTVTALDPDIGKNAEVIRTSFASS